MTQETTASNSSSEPAIWELYPDATIDQDNRAQYEGMLRRELCLNRCSSCTAWHQPPRSICPRCWSVDVRPTAVSGKGVVMMAAVLRQGKAALGVEYPYHLVTVELDEQPALRYTSAIAEDCIDQVQIGTRVTLDWVERGGAPHPVFRPDADKAPGSASDVG